MFELHIKAASAADLRSAVLGAATAHGMRLIENTSDEELLGALRDRMRPEGMVVKVAPITGEQVASTRKART